MNKPRGVISAVTSPDPRPTVRDLIPIEGRIYPVGRLDIESEGLMLMTDDGELANKITHPRYGHEKIYKVLVARHPDEQQLSAWRRGIVLEDGYRTAPVKVFVEGKSGKGAWLKVIMKEGRKRQIRETGSLLGLPVVKIIRTEMSGIQLGRLKPKEWRYLTEDEVKILRGEASPNTMSKPKLGLWRKSPAKGPGAGRRPSARNSDDARKSPLKRTGTGNKPPFKKSTDGRKPPAKNQGMRTRKSTTPKK